jgi:hypothetical protein
VYGEREAEQRVLQQAEARLDHQPAAGKLAVVAEAKGRAGEGEEGGPQPDARRRVHEAHEGLRL